jgi:DNA-binding NarL/FixJ family response regulator
VLAVARVVVACSDLLLGSKLYEGLRAVGHDVALVDDEPGVWAAVRGGTEVLVVDLGAEDFDGAVLVDSMRSDGALRGVRTLGFYPHVDQETRRRAEEVGFDLVVPRSRMAREMAELVERVAQGGGAAGGSGGGPGVGPTEAGGGGGSG